jgi:adhesin transport system outer membrane protein
MANSLNLSSLTGLEIRALSKEDVSAITPEQIATLSIPQLHSLTSVQLTWLTPAQMNALTPIQKSVLLARAAVKPKPAVTVSPAPTPTPEPTSIASAIVVETPKFETPKVDVVVESVAPAPIKQTVSTVASRFMSPDLSASASRTKQAQVKEEEPAIEEQAEVQTSKVTPIKRSNAKSFSLAHSAVYLAVITLFSSADFLTTAHSHESSLLNSVWKVEAESEVKVSMATVAIQEAVAQQPLRLPSGLVMPPESAVLPPDSAVLAQIPEARLEVKVEPKLAVAQITPSNTPKTLITVAAQSTSSAPASAVSSKRSDELMCSEASLRAPAKTALEEYMGTMPKQTSVLASLMEGKESEVQKVKSPSVATRLASNLATNGAPPPPDLVPSRLVEQPASQTPKNTDPDRYNAASWTSMQLSTDLPPRIAALGEDLISVVIKELPGSKSHSHAMSYEEFKMRVKEAVVASPDIGIVSSQVGQSQAAKSLATSGILPHVTGTADTGSRKSGRDPYIDGSKPINRSGTNYGFSVSQLVYDFGSTLSGIRAGEARLLASQELLNSKKSEQALKTISSFVELERAKAQLKLARQNASSRLAIVKLVKERSELGGGTRADIVRVESKYAEALSTISLMETRLSNAEAAYRETFGVSAKDIVNGPLHEFPIEGLNKTAEELAYSYPGLQQLARLRDATLEDYKSASGKSLPSLQLVYNNNLNGVNGPTVPADSPSRSTSMVMQLKYEFYTGGADTARKKEALYKSEQAWEEFQSGMRQYQKVLSQSQAEIRNNEDLIAARKASANSAIDSMRAVREQFSFNRGSLLDLITAQESLYQAGRDLIDASADRVLVRYRLLHLTAELDKMFDLGTLVSMNVKD